MILKNLGKMANQILLNRRCEFLQFLELELGAVIHTCLYRHVKYETQKAHIFIKRFLLSKKLFSVKMLLFFMSKSSYLQTFLYLMSNCSYF
jgi:hypothetical protein